VGLTALELGDFEAAAKATKYIIGAVSQQPNINNVFYLRPRRVKKSLRNYQWVPTCCSEMD